jgi:hypothetical protein
LERFINICNFALIKNKEMTFAEKNIIETYSHLFESLSSITKIELLERLTKSLKKEKKSKDDKFYAAFGAFPSDKSLEEEIAFIKASRKFRNKDIEF